MVSLVPSSATQTAVPQRSASIACKRALCSQPSQSAEHHAHSLGGLVCVTQQQKCDIITRLTWEIGKDAVQLRWCHFRASAMPPAAIVRNKTGYHPSRTLEAILNAAPVAMQLLNNLLKPQICFEICLQNDLPRTTIQLGAKTWHTMLLCVVLHMSSSSWLPTVGVHRSRPRKSWGVAGGGGGPN